MSHLATDGVPQEVLPGRGTAGGGLLGAIRIAFSFPVMLVAWIVLVVVRLAERNLPDPDIWWHLRNAQYLFTHHALPNVDTYSFTVAGQPWMNHEWLAEIPYYLAWRALGLEGIEILMLVLLETIFLLLVYLSYQRSHHIKASILACWFAVALGTVNFGPRTVLFGYLYMVILLIILERFHARGGRVVWILSPLFCLWINTHGSWSLGMLIFGLFIGCGMMQGQWGNLMARKWSGPEMRKLVIVYATTCATLFVNPYHYQLVTYPLDMAFRQKLNIASVSEWVSVDFHGPRGKVVLILLALLFCSAIISRYHWRLTDLAFILFAFYCGLNYDRFLFLAGIIAAPIVAEMATFVPPYQPEIDKRWLNAAIIFGILAFVTYRFPTTADLEEQIALEYPAEILPFLNANQFPGHTLNYYNWGGYLEWQAPQLKTFVDSRVDIFEHAGVFGDYLKAHGLADPEGVLDQYQIQYVLFPNQQPLTHLLESSPQWKVIFRGQTTTMLERAGPIPTHPPTEGGN
jgi:hypothetical protein